METVNYLRNRLPTKSKNHGEIIPQEIWTNQQQNLQHIRIFGSLALFNIPKEKRSKSDYQKVWEGILIGYSSDITKHFWLWALQTKQVIIASELYINESEKRAKLPAKWPLEIVSLKRKAPAGEPRPESRPQKNLISIQPALLEPVPIRIMGDVIKVNESQSKGHKMVMSITESSSKIH